VRAAPSSPRPLRERSAAQQPGEGGSANFSYVVTAEVLRNILQLAAFVEIA
jgi:hypothetical protein